MPCQLVVRGKSRPFEPPKFGRDINLCYSGLEFSPYLCVEYKQYAQKANFHLSALTFIGIKLVVWHWHTRASLLAPGSKLGSKNVDLVGMFFCQIIFLTDVLSEVK